MSKGSGRDPVPPWMAAAGAEILSFGGDELRAEAAAVEADLASHRLRTRHLRDAVGELMHRGDVVTAHLGSGSFTARVIHVGVDFLTLRTGTAPRLHLSFRSITAVSVAGDPAPVRGAAGGLSTTDTFRAQLRSLSLASAPVRLVTATAPMEIDGVIRAVAPDHLLVATRNTEWLMPTDAVAGVWA